MLTRSHARLTRQGQLRKVVTQHYLRDDLACGLEECAACGGGGGGGAPARGPTTAAAGGAAGGAARGAPPVPPARTQSISLDARERCVLVLDTNVVLHHLDVLEDAGAAVCDVVVPHTVLSEVRHRSAPAYGRLLGLLGAVSRRFVPFANEHHRDTHSPRRPGEAPNDYADRLIRAAAGWLARHYAPAGLRVVLVTEDRASAAAAAAAGIETATLRAVVTARLGGAGAPPGAARLLAALAAGPEPDSDHGDADGAPGAAAGTADAAGAAAGTAAGAMPRPALYAEHLPQHAARARVKSRTAFQGTLRVSRDCWFEGRVIIHGVEGKAGGSGGAARVGAPTGGGAGSAPRASGGDDALSVLVLGREALNRATEGDTVVIELLPRAAWRSGGSGRLVPPATAAADEDALEREALAGDAAAARRAAASPGGAGESQQDLARAAVRAGPGGATPTARVLAVLRRAWRPLCGSLEPADAAPARAGEDGGLGPAGVLFVPVDARFPRVRLDTRQRAALADARFVVALDAWEPGSKYPRGHYVRTIGRAGERATENDVILLEHDIIARPFSADVLACLPPADWRITPVNAAGRLDLRALDCVCSIDPPGCKDIDDALHARVLDGALAGGEGAGPAPAHAPGGAAPPPGGAAAPAPACRVEVGVHIADVTYFVRQGTPIDVEAAARANTTYLVERRLDMLPGLLTETLCSLKGGVDRFAFSMTCAFERVLPGGPPAEAAALARLAPADRWRLVPASVAFAKTVIHSRAAMTYAAAQALLDAPATGGAVGASVRLLASVARSLRARRIAAGALSLASAEVRFALDSETADPVDVTAYEARETNSVVEEFMLLGNCAAAERVAAAFPRAALLRRHPAPPQAQFAALLSAARAAGVSLRTESSRALAESLDAAAAAPGSTPARDKLLRILATRCMMQATYFPAGDVPPEAHAHYGLAAPKYTHFTSPIRRYADVVVHRMLAAAAALDAPTPAYEDVAFVRALADNMNRRHLASALAGRASAALTTNQFFRDRVVVESALVMRLRANGAVVLVPRFGLEAVVVLGRAAESAGAGAGASAGARAGAGAGAGSGAGAGASASAARGAPELRRLAYDEGAQTLADADGAPGLSLTVFQEVTVALFVADAARGRKELVVRIIAPAFQNTPEAVGSGGPRAGEGGGDASAAGTKRPASAAAEGGDGRGALKRGRVA